MNGLNEILDQDDPLMTYELRVDPHIPFISARVMYRSICCVLACAGDGSQRQDIQNRKVGLNFCHHLVVNVIYPGKCLLKRTRNPSLYCSPIQTNNNLSPPFKYLENFLAAT